MFRDLLNLLKPGSGVPVDERREQVRLDCLISAVLKHKNQTRECRVVNASLTGLQIELESKIRKRSQVSLHRDQHGGPVLGSVMWCRAKRGDNRYRAGIRYHDDPKMLRDSWIKPALKDLGFSVGRIKEKRQLTRVPGQKRRCFLKSMSGDTYSSGELINLSVGGALVELEVELPDGLELLLKIDPIENVGELSATVVVASCKRNRQTRQYSCGLRFVEVDLKLVRRHMSVMMGEC